jgi:hypothetical protein
MAHDHHRKGEGRSVTFQWDPRIMMQPRESNAVKSKIGKGTHGRLIPNARHPARVQDPGVWKKRRQRNDADEMVQISSIVHEGNVCRFLTALRISAPLSGDDQCRLSIRIRELGKIPTPSYPPLRQRALAFPGTPTLALFPTRSCSARKA